MTDLTIAADKLAKFHQGEFPPHVASRTAQQRYDWLNSPEAARLLSRSARKRLRRPLLLVLRAAVSPGLVAAQAERQREVVRKFVASEPWRLEVAAALDRARVWTTRRSVVLAAVVQAGIHPIRGSVYVRDGRGGTTERRVWLHRRCHECGHLAPAGEVSDAGWCSDCRTDWVEICRIQREA